MPHVHGSSRPARRALVLLLALLPWMGACAESGGGPPMLRDTFPHAQAPGESAGGVPCLGCHGSAPHAAMTASQGYHHYLRSDDPVAAVVTAPLGGTDDASRTCLLCHADHDAFVPSQNPQSPGRAHNLRVSAAVAPTSDPSTFTNADVVPSQTHGGLCLSCHRFVQTKSYAAPDATAATPAVDKDLFLAAVPGHNYTVASSFASDGSAFLANCLKCHDDARAKAMQDSDPAFSLHDSLYAGLLAPLGASFDPADPPTSAQPNLLEETLCFRCHGPSASYASADGPDVFGACASMPARALNLRALFEDASRPHRHPVTDHRGRHRPSGGNDTPASPDDLEGARHAECADCHNPHAARRGVLASTGNAVQDALRGAWGVEPSYNAGDPVPASFAVAAPAGREYQVCLKCHSSYVSGAQALGRSFSPENASFHPVMAASTNPAMPEALLEPWYSLSDRRMSCSHCHGNGDTDARAPRGPHASEHEHILRRPYAPAGSVQPDGDLCFACHDAYTYAGHGSAPSGYASDWTRFRRNNRNLHTDPPGHAQYGCRACHRAHGASRERLCELYDAAANPDGRLTSMMLRNPGMWAKGSCGTRTGCH